MLFLGVDVGGSKTHALICDQAGQVLGFGEGPGGNPETVGYPGLTLSMQTTIENALGQSSIDLDQIVAAGFGIAGYDWAYQYPDTLQAVQALGLPCQHLVIENDAVPPILAGTSAGWGIAACVGTGNNVRGIDASGRVGRITGNSAPFGEFGGASEIMDTVLQRLAWMWTGRGAKTSLATMLVENCGASHLDDLITGLVAGKYKLDTSQLPLVVQAAEQGDDVAQEVLAWNAQELAQSAIAVARQLDLADQSFELVMAGHLFEVCGLFQKTFREGVLLSIPFAQINLLSLPPVCGAVLMAMKSFGIDYKIPRNSLLQQEFLHY